MPGKQQIVERFILRNPGKGICYSGYREGQSPRQGIFPSFQEIREDLLILDPQWSFLRLYDPSQHAETTLSVIREEGLDLKVMLGIDLAAELSNPNCPWGADYDDETLAANRQSNRDDIDRAVTLANHYADIVFSVSVGNEASVFWTDHLVSVDSLVAYARRLKEAVIQPVTYCETYASWTSKLAPLAAELDFISTQIYPIWEQRTIDDALDFTKESYYSVVDHYPGKPVIITEAGWTTASNGKGIKSGNASEALQARYCKQLMGWSSAEGILTFIFEAFDEPWKGSPDPLEPEKHWGLFYVDRTPKQFMQSLIGAGI